MGRGGEAGSSSGVGAAQVRLGVTSAVPFQTKPPMDNPFPKPHYRAPSFNLKTDSSERSPLPHTPPHRPFPHFTPHSFPRAGHVVAAAKLKNPPRFFLYIFFLGVALPRPSPPPTHPVPSNP